VVAAMQANDWDASGEVKATVGKPRWPIDSARVSR